MVRIGELNRLKVEKQVDFGVFLTAGSDGRILLPKRYVPAATKIGDELEVFIYLDSEDQLIATTETPKIKVGGTALLQVKDVNPYGAFLDWGLPKDLMVPYKEQAQPMRAGQAYVVYAYLDSTDRIVASSRLDRHLPETSPDYKPGQAVELLVWGKTNMGYKVVINQGCLGLLFKDDAFKPLRVGQRIQGFIKSIRQDGKIDVSLQLHSQRGRDVLSEKIVSYLRQNGGVSDLTDKTPPDLIYRQFNVSKAAYKKALGGLYKAKVISISPEQITLLKE